MPCKNQVASYNKKGLASYLVQIIQGKENILYSMLLPIVATSQENPCMSKAILESIQNIYAGSSRGVER